MKFTLKSVFFTFISILTLILPTPAEAAIAPLPNLQMDVEFVTASAIKGGLHGGDVTFGITFEVEAYDTIFLDKSATSAEVPMHYPVSLGQGLKWEIEYIEGSIPANLYIMNFKSLSPANGGDTNEAWKVTAGTKRTFKLELEISYQPGTKEAYGGHLWAALDVGWVNWGSLSGSSAPNYTPLDTNVFTTGPVDVFNPPGVVPEPASTLLFIGGLAMLGARRKRQ